MAISKHCGIKIKGIVNVIPALTEDNLQLPIIDEKDRQMSNNTSRTNFPHKFSRSEKEQNLTR